MGNLFDAQDAASIIARINKLKPDTLAYWGKMNVGQMLAHCQEVMRTAFGNSSLKRNLFGILFGWIAKKAVVSEKPYRRNLPTAPSFVMRDEKNFEAEKAKLLAMVEEFVNGGPAVLTKNPHPFFGRLTAEQWGTTQWKHLDHHLRQFGV